MWTGDVSSTWAAEMGGASGSGILTARHDGICLLFVAAELLCYVDSPVVPPLHCFWVDVAWSAIEVPHDELFKMLVNFLLLISFLDEHFIQICCRFNEEFRFGADLTVPM